MRETADRLRPIADALDSIHRMHPPVVHRDIKPANVLLPDVGPDTSGSSAGMDGAILTDFGISLVRGDSRLTSAGTLVGSEQYMAPERYVSENDDSDLGIRADNYSLALVAWEMLTLTPLYATMNLSQWRFGDRSPRLAPEVLARVDRGKASALTGVFEWLLASDPAQRPATSGALIDSLEALSTVDLASVRSSPVYGPVHNPGHSLNHGDVPDTPDNLEPGFSPSSGSLPAPAATPGARSARSTPRPSPQPPGTTGSGKPSPVSGARRRPTAATYRRRRLTLAAVILVVLVISGVAATRWITAGRGEAAAGTSSWPVEYATLEEGFPMVVPPSPGGVSAVGLTCDPATPETGQLALIVCRSGSTTVTLASYQSTSVRNSLLSPQTQTVPSDSGDAGADASGTDECPGGETFTDRAGRTVYLPDALPIIATVTAPDEEIQAFLHSFCPVTGGRYSATYR